MKYAPKPWAARYNTWLLIKLTPKGVSSCILFFSCLHQKLQAKRHRCHPPQLAVHERNNAPTQSTLSQHSPTHARVHTRTHLYSVSSTDPALPCKLITRRRLCRQLAYGTLLQACSRPITSLTTTQQPVDHHILQLTSPTQLILLMATGARRLSNRRDIKGIARHTAMQATEPAAASRMHVPCEVVWKAVVPRGEPIAYKSISPHVRHRPQASAHM